MGCCISAQPSLKKDQQFASDELCDVDPFMPTIQELEGSIIIIDDDHDNCNKSQTLTKVNTTTNSQTTQPQQLVKASTDPKPPAIMPTVLPKETTQSPTPSNTNTNTISLQQSSASATSQIRNCAQKEAKKITDGISVKVKHMTTIFDKNTIWTGKMDYYIENEMKELPLELTMIDDWTIYEFDGQIQYSIQGRRNKKVSKVMCFQTTV